MLGVSTIHGESGAFCDNALMVSAERTVSASPAPFLSECDTYTVTYRKVVHARTKLDDGSHDLMSGYAWECAPVYRLAELLDIREADP